MNSGREGKLRVVADTNILISALHFGGKAEVFLGMASSRLFLLFLSKYILWEMRMILIKKFQWSEDMAYEAERVLFETAALVHPSEKISMIKKDEADNRILECVVAAKADILVTNDKRHLLPLKRFRGIRILDLDTFLHEFSPK